jgi:uncharacterized membrane protein YccC
LFCFDLLCAVLRFVVVLCCVLVWCAVSYLIAFISGRLLHMLYHYVLHRLCSYVEQQRAAQHKQQRNRIHQETTKNIKEEQVNTQNTNA